MRPSSRRALGAGSAMPRRAASPAAVRVSADICADPFEEQGTRLARRRIRLLGGDFEFSTDSRALARLVEHAYADLPAHRLSPLVPRLEVRLRAGPPAHAGSGGPIPALGLLSSGRLLGGATASSTFAAISAADRSALIVVARDMLPHRYHVRYELIEFTVFTLAARAQGLVPLHAACLGRGGRGLLIMGDSGAGKSTAMLHGALRGLEYVSEDSTFVAPDSMRATGVANFLHLRRDSLRFVPPPVASRLRRFPTIRRRNGVAKLEIDVRRGDWALAREPVRVGAVAFVTAREAGSKPLLVPLRARDVRGRLEALQPYAARRAEWPAFTRRLGETPAFELRRGRHPDQTADALASLLDAGPAPRTG